MKTGWTRRSFRSGAVETSYIEAGDGAPLVLLHGGEFGASAELAWERVIDGFAATRHVIAPDILGFGESSKSVDFIDGKAWRLLHIAALLDELGIDNADFLGNSMGGSMLLSDAASENPYLPVRRMVPICGGGEVESNEFMASLMNYDASLEGMRAIVHAMFHNPDYASDEAYVSRRYESATQPGAWEAVAAARFRRPGHASSGGGELEYDRITVPTLVVAGAEDKLKPAGWAERLAERLPRGSAAVIADAGHCPQIEQPERFLEAVGEFLNGGDEDAG